MSTVDPRIAALDAAYSAGRLTDVEYGTALAAAAANFTRAGTDDTVSAVRQSVDARFAQERNVDVIHNFFRMLATGQVDAGTARAKKASATDIHGAAQKLMAAHGDRFSALAERFDEVLHEVPRLSLAMNIAQTLARSAFVEVALQAIPAPSGVRELALPYIVKLVKEFGNGGFAGLSKEVARAADNKVVDASLKFLRFIKADKFAAHLLASPVGKSVGQIGLSLMNDDRELVTKQVGGLFHTAFEVMKHALTGKHPDHVEVEDAELAGAGAR